MTMMRLHYRTSCTVCSDNINKQNEIQYSLHLFDNGALPRLTSTCTEKIKMSPTSQKIRQLQDDKDVYRSAMHTSQSLSVTAGMSEGKPTMPDS